MDAVIGLVVLGLLFLAGVMALALVIGLFSPASVLPEEQPKTRGAVLKIAGGSVVVLLALAVGVGSLSSGGARSGSPDQAAAADGASAQGQAENALRDALGWGGTAAEEVTEVRSTPLSGGGHLGQVFVTVQQSWDDADAVRTWGMAIKEVATGAHPTATRFYDRYLFYIEAPAQGGGTTLAAKVKMDTADLRPLVGGPEKPYQRYLDQARSLELRPVGQRSVAAWCRSRRSEAPAFCQVASR